MGCMFKGSFQKFFFAKTVHRIPKLVTLGVATSLLVAMVNLDASASSLAGGNANTLSTAALIKLAAGTAKHEHSGVIRRHFPVKSTSPTTSTTSPSTTGGGSSHGTTT